MDLALESNGAIVTASSSFDPNHPPMSIIDGNEGTFWSSTGLFPQEFIIQLPDPSSVTQVNTMTTNVKSMIIERCEAAAPITWEKVVGREIKDSDGRMQIQNFDLQDTTGAQFIKVKILSGWSDFVTVHQTNIFGEGLEGK